MERCFDSARLEPPARMPTCRSRDRDRGHGVTVVGRSPSSSTAPPLLDLASPTAPRRPPHPSPRSPSTAAGGGGGSSAVQPAHSCPSAASDDDSGCALEEYAWVPPGLSALQVI